MHKICFISKFGFQNEPFVTQLTKHLKLVFGDFTFITKNVRIVQNILLWIVTLQVVSFHIYHF